MSVLEYTAEVERATVGARDKLGKIYDDAKWREIAPYIYEINRLKEEKNAIILAHNYIVPSIFHGVADIVGDSLALARKAAQTEAKILCQATVIFMAETSKILCPEKVVLQPDMDAGCTLADSINAEDVRNLRKKYPGAPIVAYVNTSAEVKAEVDVCCTSANAVEIVNALEGDEVVMLPDMHLAKHVAAHSKKTVHMWKGICVVHDPFSGEEMRALKAKHEGVVIIAHPECPLDVLEEADHVGSTVQMINYIEKHRPSRVALITEDVMSDNMAPEYPDVEFVRTRRPCPYMKRITLESVLRSLQTMQTQIEVAPETARRARKPIERMLEMSK